VVIGAGPVGLAAAIDLTLHGVPVTLLEEDSTFSSGSRAICWAKRTLEIFDRLGVAAPILRKGITWNTGKVFHGNELLYSFNLLAEAGQKMPAFVNLQQTCVEEFLAARARELGVDLRWNNRVVGLAQDENGVTLQVETPEGLQELRSEYALAADGAHSSIRKMLGLSFEGKVFEDRFLIADVHMNADFPMERWFWFDPPFHPGKSALLHRQAGDIWRIDLQLSGDADPEEEGRPERVISRLKAMLGENSDFKLEWVSVYQFQCRRLEQFRHDRIIFMGDSAHQVSPFGARGGNSGVQDADNLCWKLARVLRGIASQRLLDSYEEERILAADENILSSTRSTDFMSPKGHGSQLFRDAVLLLARRHEFARQFVNSGRLSTPTILNGCALQTPDPDEFNAGLVPGSPCLDAPVQMTSGESAWLLSHLGNEFCLLGFTEIAGQFISEFARTIRQAKGLGIYLGGIVISERVHIDGCRSLRDSSGLVRSRYDGREESVYLIRPDQHVAARWRRMDCESALAALSRAAQFHSASPTGVGE
jgi:3-(3-hydroxy-phenyl)propionate hydroxylase